jgi:hypothetical protein|nr:MAG TPA: Protein of unknown function (DUF2997) [Caudoviricetes sp.]
MRKETVEIRINEKGGYTFQAKEGFSGTSCIERTKDLELALGGTVVSKEKTKEFYEADPSSPVTIKLN